VAALICQLQSTGCLFSALSYPFDTKTEQIHDGAGMNATDACNNPVCIPPPARRIICKSSGATELLVVIGAGDTVVLYRIRPVFNDRRYLNKKNVDP
jgi:ABC-type Fe3+-hydroxamate transport system substrate-binding protein